MYPVSQDFKNTVAGSHVIATSLDVLRNSQLIGNIKAVLPQSEVTVDRTQGIRSRCTLKLFDDGSGLVPTDPTSKLSPLTGDEVRLWRGVVNPATIGYGATTKALNPSGLWRLGDTSDASGHAQTLTQVGGVTFPTPGVTAGDGYAALDGTSGYLTGVATGTPKFSLRLWAKSNSATWNDNGVLWSARGPNGWIVHPNVGTTAIYFYIVDNAGAFWSVASIDPGAGAIQVWHQYVFTWDGSQARAYMDGALLTTGGTVTIPRDTTASITHYLGKDSTLGRFFNGSLDEAAYFSYALTDQQIRADYEARQLPADSTASTELVPLGTFQIVDAHVDDTGTDEVITIDGYDRANAVGRNKLTDHYQIAAGTNYMTAIQTLINNAVPGYNYAFTPTTLTTPALTFHAGDDPWTKATEMARAIGYELFFDPLGTCVCQPVADPATQPTAWTFAEGPTCTVTEIERVLSNTQAPNKVIRDGTNSANQPVRGVAQITNPNDPMVVGGSYGTVVDYQSDPAITTTGQAQAAAQAVLYNGKGWADQILMKAAPNPALQAGDVVQVTRARQGLSASPYIIDVLKMPAGTTYMELTMRRIPS